MRSLRVTCCALILVAAAVSAVQAQLRRDYKIVERRPDSKADLSVHRPGVDPVHTTTRPDLELDMVDRRTALNELMMTHRTCHEALVARRSSMGERFSTLRSDLELELVDRRPIHGDLVRHRTSLGENYSVQYPTPKDE